MNKLVLAVCMLAIGSVVALGLFLFVKGLRNIQMAIASTRWPTVAGMVVSSRTTRDASPETRKSPSVVTYGTKTVIRYTADGKDYTTDILHFGQTLGSGNKSEAALQRLRFPADTSVTVSYNPGKNPAVAVMKPGLHADAFWLPGAGLAFLLPAALCLLMAPAMVRSSQANDQAFENYVQQSMERSRRGEMPVGRPVLPGSLRTGGSVMAVAASGFGALILGLGVLALTAGLQRGWHGLASEHWPTTSGVVILAGTTTTDDGDETTDDPTSKSRYARFVYQYDVAGKKHFNNVRQFAQVEGGDAAEIERLRTRYAQGASVRVSYFPTDPDVAVLEPGNTGAAFILPAVGGVLLLFGLAIFIWVAPGVAR